MPDPLEARPPSEAQALADRAGAFRLTAAGGNAFEVESGELRCDGTPLSELAQRHGTPLYVYSARAVEERFRAISAAFPGALVCYSVKANSNLSILTLLARLGSAFDIVSEGELVRVAAAGAEPSKIVFAGVGKTEDEMRRAIAMGPVIFNVESGEELRVLATLAKEARATVPFALRVNPDVDPKTHTYISTGKRENKFGVDLASAERIARDALAAGMRGAVVFSGIHVHIGSQILDPAPYAAAVERAAAFAKTCRAMGHDVRFLNVGGGFGIDYEAAESLPFDAFAEAIRSAMKGSSLALLLEPGRSLVANAGALVATVIRVKTSGDRRFVIVDAAMNDLIRPSLYQAHHRIVPVVTRPGGESACDVVGPICESGDFLALDRALPPLEAGDRIAILSAGAYGFSMSSQYNTRRRAAEVLVEGESARVIRDRETYDEMLENERRHL